jgi:hypothetical protein
MFQLDHDPPRHPAHLLRDSSVKKIHETVEKDKGRA